MPGTNRLIWGNRSAHHVIYLFIIIRASARAPGVLAAGDLECWELPGWFPVTIQKFHEVCDAGGQEKRNWRENVFIAAAW